MPARRPRSRHAGPDCAARLLGAGLLLGALALPRAASAYTPGQTNGAGGTGGFANPFPDAATAPAGAPQPGTLPPPDYRYQGTLPLVVGGLPTPGFTILPQLSLQEEFTDNVLQTETNRRWDLISLLTPSLTIGANTPRLNLSLQYAPTLEYYARTTSENTIAQQLLGVGSLVLVPDTLFVNARAYATMAPTNGGYLGAGYGAATPAAAFAGAAGTGAAGTGPLTGRQGTTQIFGLSVSPYLVHRFNTFGTGSLGATFSRTSASNSLGGGAQEETTEQVSGQFQTGSYFGRVQDTAAANASRTQGSGFLNASRQETITDQLGYALTRQLQVFGVLGYEDISYGNAGVPPIRDAIWRFGGTFTPTPSSSFTLSYGHSQGATDFEAAANYALSPRTFFTASYSDVVTTYLQQVAAGLAGAAVNQNGVPVGPDGQPLVLVNGALAVQDTVYRDRTLALGLTALRDRDTYSLSITRTEDTPLSAGGFAQRALTATASWTHALSELANASTYVSYGDINTGGATGDSKLFSFSALFTYQLSNTVSTSASYLFFRRNSTAPGFSMYENILVVGISKRF